MKHRTWVTTAETLALVAILVAVPSTLLRVLLGIPIVLHLGWSVMTSVPVGGVPGPPPGVGERRRNHRLRYRVVEFLREVKRLEAFARQANGRGSSDPDVEKNVRGAEQRLHDVVAEIIRVAGRSGV